MWCGCLRFCSCFVFGGCFRLALLLLGAAFPFCCLFWGGVGPAWFSGFLSAFLVPGPPALCPLFVPFLRRRLPPRCARGGSRGGASRSRGLFLRSLYSYLYWLGGGGGGGFGPGHGRWSPPTLLCFHSHWAFALCSSGVYVRSLWYFRCPLGGSFSGGGPGS